MSVLEEIDLIQSRLEKPLGTVPENLQESMDWISTQIARVTEMRDGAVELLTQKRLTVANGLSDAEMSATKFKALVEGGCVAEQKLVNRLESVLRSMSKKFDAAQSSLSWQKAEKLRQTHP